MRVYVSACALILLRSRHETAFLLAKVRRYSSIDFLITGFIEGVLEVLYCHSTAAELMFVADVMKLFSCCCIKPISVSRMSFYLSFAK